MTIALISAALLLASINGIRQLRRIEKLESDIAALKVVQSNLAGQIATITN